MSDAAQATPERSAEIGLLPGRHSYLLFLPPGAARRPIVRLRLVAEGLKAIVVVKRIGVRSIP